MSKHIRVIAPSLFVDISSSEIQRAKERLENKGFEISFSEGLLNGKPSAITDSLSLTKRIEDLMNAYQDDKVSFIIPITGGYNANQLLPYIDFGVIKSNPKIFCGYSDITVLNNAIYAKTGQFTFSGPNFKNFGVYEDNIFKFIFDGFLKVTSRNLASLEQSSKWIDSSDCYQENEHFLYNSGIKIIRDGEFSGKLLGGNLCSFNLLQGTPFIPDLTNSVLFIEDDLIFTSTKTFLLEFERNLVSLIQQPNFEKVKGLMIGRFEEKSGISINMIEKIIKSHSELEKLPILANLDFGHTTPLWTLPIGETISYSNQTLYIIGEN